MQKDCGVVILTAVTSAGTAATTATEGAPDAVRLRQEVIARWTDLSAVTAETDLEHLKSIVERGLSQADGRTPISAADLGSPAFKNRYLTVMPLGCTATAGDINGARAIHSLIEEWLSAVFNKRLQIRFRKLGGETYLEVKVITA